MEVGKGGAGGGEGGLCGRLCQMRQDWGWLPHPTILLKSIGIPITRMIKKLAPAERAESQYRKPRSIWTPYAHEPWPLRRAAWKGQI